MLTLEEKLIFEFNIMLLCIIILIQFLYRPKFKSEHAQPAPTSASGIFTIYDPNGTLAAGVDVVMNDANGTEVGRQQTDANGQASFTSSVEGSFTIAVPVYGYSQPVTVQFGIDFSMQIGAPRVLSLGCKNRVNLMSFKTFNLRVQCIWM